MKVTNNSMCEIENGIFWDNVSATLHLYIVFMFALKKKKSIYEQVDSEYTYISGESDSF